MGDFMYYKDVNDYELLYMVQENSDESMEMMLDKYRPFIEQKIRKWLSIYAKLGLERDDVRQEIYFVFCSAIRSYDDQGGATFYTYICKVIDNHMSALVRAQASKANQLFTQAVSLSSLSSDHETFLQDLLEDPKARIEERLDESFLISIFQDFCYELPFEQAEIFELFLGGFDVPSIAELMEYPNSKVSHTLFRLRKRLKKRLIQERVSIII